MTGDVLDIKGQQSVSYMLNRYEFKHTFLVCSLPTDTVGLVGTNFMASLGVFIDFECCNLLLSDNRKVPRVYSLPPIEHTAFKIISEGKAGRSPQLRKHEARQMYWQVPAGLRPEIKEQENDSWLFRANKTFRVAPRIRQIVRSQSINL